MTSSSTVINDSLNLLSYALHSLLVVVVVVVVVVTCSSSNVTGSST